MRTQWIALIALQAATSVLGAGVHQQSVQTVGPYLLVPVAGSARGVGNTDFKTDLTIRNGGNSNANVQLLFLPANRDNSVSDKTVVVATIEPSRTYTYEDVVGSLLGKSGFGALLLMASEGELGDGRPSDQGARLAAAYRIYTPQPGGEGTTSQSSDAVDVNRSPFFPSGTISGLRQDLSFRTNVGVVNLDAHASRTFRITPASPVNQTFQMDLVVPPMSMTQRPLPPGNYGQLTLRVELLNPEEENNSFWTAYGSSIDNITGDAWLQMIAPQ